MLVFIGFDRARHEHLYCVRRSDRWIHCLTQDYHFSNYQKALVSPNKRLVLFTALDNERNEFLHCILDMVQGSIDTLDFTFNEYRLVKWVNDQKIIVGNKRGYTLVDIHTENMQHIDGSQTAEIFDMTSDERYVVMTTDQAAFTVSLWDRKYDTTKPIDLREHDNSCWIESVAGWTPDERFFAVVANYSELWLITKNGADWYKLVDLEYFHMAYRWSPDSQWLSYFRALDQGGPGTSFGMICLVKSDASAHRELVTIDDGDWDWLSDTEIARISRDNDAVVVDVIDVLTGMQTRLLSEGEPIIDFAFRR